MNPAKFKKPKNLKKKSSRIPQKTDDFKLRRKSPQKTEDPSKIRRSPQKIEDPSKIRRRSPHQTDPTKISPQKTRDWLSSNPNFSKIPRSNKSLSSASTSSKSSSRSKSKDHKDAETPQTPVKLVIEKTDSLEDTKSFTFNKQPICSSLNTCHCIENQLSCQQSRRESCFSSISCDSLQGQKAFSCIETNKDKLEVDERCLRSFSFDLEKESAYQRICSSAMEQAQEFKKDICQLVDSDLCTSPNTSTCSLASQSLDDGGFDRKGRYTPVDELFVASRKKFKSSLNLAKADGISTKEWSRNRSFLLRMNESRRKQHKKAWSDKMTPQKYESPIINKRNKMLEELTNEMIEIKQCYKDEKISNLEKKLEFVEEVAKKMEEKLKEVENEKRKFENEQKILEIKCEQLEDLLDAQRVPLPDTSEDESKNPEDVGRLHKITIDKKDVFCQTEDLQMKIKDVVIPKSLICVFKFGMMAWLLTDSIIYERFQGHQLVDIFQRLI